jgi:valyl-tRNA synthetase
MELPKSYNPQDYEDKIYKLWEKSGAFTPKIDPKKKPFVISMPPPNVTGKLHIGHALVVTLEDIMVRYHRMHGDPTLWLPGTDHAGIATQSVVERQLKKEGKSRHDLGREKFIERVWEWKEKYGGEIINQTKKLGASCDWSRERFTLDKGLSEAVNTAFINLYNKGLIYRGLRTVNWCPKCHTAIADDEVEYKKEIGKFYWIKYGPFILATARPETKLGDTAVAVHPSDKRYKDMVGKKYMIPGVLGEFEIKVVADNAVDPKFGTGAVKVTPAHSLIDFEISQRHNVPIKQVIDDRGRMMENTGKYAGMKTKEAREAIVEDMKKMGLIEKIEENYEHNVGVCYRCGSVIEPIPSLQWFITMKPLAEKAKKIVMDGDIEILPKRFEKVYFHWMDNIRDWCISRQLWWGHRIPVYYRNSKLKAKNEKLETEKIYVGNHPPEGYIQDPDVLDTWFSSALWPFSTLGWPDKKAKDYQYFFPTTVIETGYDILFFWISRMIMMSLELTGKPPFKTVYLHGLVRDEQNRKMSKSLGNALDPLEVASKYGTDAVRMSLVVGTTAGNDSKTGESKIKGYRNFSNKLWNIARFITTNLEISNFQFPTSGKFSEYQLSNQDKKDLKRLNEIIKKTTKYLDSFKFSQAGELLYEYTWHEFADKIIEESKPRINGDNKDDRIAVLFKLYKILETILKLLHPFVPFVTEAIWQKTSHKTKPESNLINSSWPSPDA